MPEFRERLDEAMRIRDISAAELSRISKVNEGAISQYRAGKYKASQRSLDKLARALNVSIPWLMGADVPMERDANTDLEDNIAESLTEESLAIASAYQKAAPAVKFSVRKLLDIPEQAIQFGLVARDGQGTIITATKETVDAAAKERQRLLEDDDQPNL